MTTSARRKSPASNTPTAESTPPKLSSLASTPPALLPNTAFDPVFNQVFDSGTIGSPLKRARASVSGVDDEALHQRLGLGLSGVVESEVARPAEAAKSAKTSEEEDDEEL